MVILSTERLILREFEKQDFPSVHEYASDPEVVKFMPWDPTHPQRLGALLKTQYRTR